MVLMAMNWAAWPLAAATAATPPSSAATRFSNTSLECSPVSVNLDVLIARPGHVTYYCWVSDARINVPEGTKTEQIRSVLKVYT